MAKMKKVEDTMRSRVLAYLRERRALGYKLRIEGELLLNFACFADRSGHVGPPTKSLMLRWATLPEKGERLYKARRLEIVRVFAKHLASEEPQTELPARHVLGPAHQRQPAHLFTAPQIKQLLTRAKRLSGDLRPSTYHALFGILACTGLRISEALKLNAADLDLSNAVLTVRESKYRLTRLVPLHRTALPPLRAYLRERRRRGCLTERLFVSDKGLPLPYSTVRHTFWSLTKDITPTSGRRYVRMHDLRHTFACRVLLRWERSERRAIGRLAILTRYMGHSRVTDTYWYLTATPALLSKAARNFKYPSR